MLRFVERAVGIQGILDSGTRSRDSGNSGFRNFGIPGIPRHSHTQDRSFARLTSNQCEVLVCWNSYVVYSTGALLDFGRCSHWNAPEHSVLELNPIVVPAHHQLSAPELDGVVLNPFSIFDLAALKFEIVDPWIFFHDRFVIRSPSLPKLLN